MTQRAIPGLFDTFGTTWRVICFILSVSSLPLPSKEDPFGESLADRHRLNWSKLTTTSLTCSPFCQQIPAASQTIISSSGTEFGQY